MDGCVFLERGHAAEALSAHSAGELDATFVVHPALVIHQQVAPHEALRAEVTLERLPMGLQLVHCTQRCLQ